MKPSGSLGWILSLLHSNNAHVSVPYINRKVSVATVLSTASHITRKLVRDLRFTLTGFLIIYLVVVFWGDGVVGLYTLYSLRRRSDTQLKDTREPPKPAESDPSSPNRLRHAHGDQVHLPNALAFEPRPLPPQSTLAARLGPFFAAAQQILSISISATLPMLTALWIPFCCIFINRTWWWFLPYLALGYYRTYIDKSGPREPSQWFKTLPLWHHCAQYFPAQVLLRDSSVQLPPDKPYIFGYHPHGILGVGFVLAFGGNGLKFSSLFPGLKIRCCTLPFLFICPFIREWLLAQGFIDVRQESLDRQLRQGSGHGIAVIIGGAREAEFAYPHNNDIIFRKRKGIFRTAFRHGCRLVPVYCFGENHTFFVYPPSPLQRFVSRVTKISFGWCLPPFYGRGMLQSRLGSLPRRSRISLVIGRPIDVPKIETPTASQIDELQAQYGNALKDLFEFGKKQCWSTYEAAKEKPLKFVD